MKDGSRMGFAFLFVIVWAVGCATKEVLTSDQRTEWEETVARESIKSPEAQPIWRMSPSGIVTVVEMPDIELDSDTTDDE